MCVLKSGVVFVSLACMTLSDKGPDDDNTDHLCHNRLSTRC